MSEVAFATSNAYALNLERSAELIHCGTMLSENPVMYCGTFADAPYVTVALSTLLIACATACRRRLSWNAAAFSQWKTIAGPVYAGPRTIRTPASVKALSVARGKPCVA